MRIRSRTLLSSTPLDDESWEYQLQSTCCININDCVPICRHNVRDYLAGATHCLRLHPYLKKQKCVNNAGRLMRVRLVVGTGSVVENSFLRDDVFY